MRRGSQFVLAAILLMLLSPLRCATIPVRDEFPSCSGPNYSCTHLLLRSSRRSNFDSPVSVYRNGTVNTSPRKYNKNSLLRLMTASSGPESHKQGNLSINIYNAQAKRYICFNQNGRVRTRRRLPRGRRSRLVCRFMEQLVRQRKPNLYEYVADEPRRTKNKERVISFCGTRRDRVATLRRRPSGRRAQRRRQRQRQRQRHMNSFRRKSRRRHRRQRRAVESTRQQRRARNRHWCQSAFMKRLSLQ